MRSLSIFNSAFIGSLKKGISLLLSLTTGTTETGMTASSVRGFGNKLLSSHALVGKTITKLTLDFKTAQAGTITVGVWNGSNVLQITLGTLDASTLTGAFVAYSFENLTGHVLATDNIIGWSVSGSATGMTSRRVGTSVDANMGGVVINNAATWGVTDPNEDNNMLVYGV